MRTIDEIEREIERIDADLNETETADQESYLEGMKYGMTVALKMLRNGQTSADMLDQAFEHRQKYHSVGDDTDNRYNSGFDVALCWAGEEFDWDTNGTAAFRKGGEVKW
jgi:hypothetical protein